MMIQPGGSSIDPTAVEANAVLRSIIPAMGKLQDGIGALITIILGWWCASIEVFIRYDFGERYLSMTRLFLAAFIMVILWLPSVFSYPTGFGGIPINWTTLYFLAFLGLSAMHRLRIWLRYQNKIPWHSMSFGISRLADLNLPLIGNDDWTLYRWYEPLFCLFAGLILGAVEYTLGIWLCISAFALLFRNNMSYFQYRARILDIIDASLDAQWLNEEALNRDKRQNAGIASMSVVWPVMPNTALASVPGSETTPDFTKTVASTLNTPDAAPLPQSITADVVDFAGTVADTLMLNTEDVEVFSDEDDKKSDGTILY